jgi:transposase-like protein
MSELDNTDKQEVGRWANNRVENSHLPFRRRERAMLRFRQMKSLQKSSPQFTPMSTITSTWNATLPTERPTRPAARPLWSSGRTSWPKQRLGRGELC